MASRSSAARKKKAASAAAVSKAAEQKYTIEKLRENSMKLFGITISTFDGAFYGVKATEMSVKEAKSIINKWLGKE